LGLRRRARECALQMLYQVDQTGIAPTDLFVQFWLGQPAADEVRSFAERLVLGVSERRDEMDDLIIDSADHWRIDRMAVVDRNVLRMALFEMLHERATPAVVVIDEAIEVAKKYGSPESGGFINGILDSVRQRMQSDGTDLLLQADDE
jgi:N utilization substance protein B